MYAKKGFFPINARVPVGVLAFSLRWIRYRSCARCDEREGLGGRGSSASWVQVGTRPGGPRAGAAATHCARNEGRRPRRHLVLPLPFQLWTHVRP